MIKLTDVKKTFSLGSETLEILKDIDIEIKEQEYISILGKSGSGKSTLMYILGLLDSATSGSVKINNIEASTLNDDEVSTLRNEFIGFVFQQFNLINKLTVLENITLPAVYHKSALDFDPVARATELLERFEIAHRINSYPNKISGGEQQRVAIARALILNPELILADEPTGNLDSANGEKIMQLLEELNKKDKKTVIIVTHDDEIARRTKRNIFIKDGVVVKKL